MLNPIPLTQQVQSRHVWVWTHYQCKFPDKRYRPQFDSGDESSEQSALFTYSKLGTAIYCVPCARLEYKVRTNCLKSSLWSFHVVRTVHFGMKLYNYQHNAQVFNLFVYLLLSYMFRAFFHPIFRGRCTTSAVVQAPWVGCHRPAEIEQRPLTMGWKKARNMQGRSK
jgi:hypothetical protein